MLISSVKLDDAHQMRKLVLRVFGIFVAPEYTEQGIEQFHRYMGLDWLMDRMCSTNYVHFSAHHRDQIVAVIEVRDFEHISLFFVDERLQRQGIGRRLLSYAIERCLNQYPLLQTMTVNAAPNSASAYKRFGFVSTQTMQITNGIKYLPMVLQLKEPGRG